MEVVMKAVGLLLSLSILASCHPARPPERPAARPLAAVDPVTLAQRFVDHLVAGRFTEATAHFDAPMAKALPAAALRAAWIRRLAELGAFRRQVETRRFEKNDVVGVVVTCELALGRLDVRVFLKAGRFIGRFFVPAETEAARAKIPLATRLVEHLAAGRFAEVVASFSPEMASRLTAEQLAARWAGIVGEVGAFKRMASAGTQSREGMVAVVMTCEFERGSRIVRVVFSGDRVVGLFFRVGG
jgi:hypothetical protein